jgi:magnesium-transporting ATPase (P-type)
VDAGVDEAVPATEVVGLSAAEAARRLAQDGRNELPLPPAPAVWRRLVAQMVHFFALLLWVAGVLAFVAGMPQLGIAIFVVVVVNGLFAFAQEWRAERAAERLQQLLPRRVTVVRDGVERDVDATELVRGDLVLLHPGDRASADMGVVFADDLTVDTSMLTGESVPTVLDVGELVHAGTFVVVGEGRAVVTATGAGTRLAGIAALSRSEARPKTPLAIELDRIVRIVAALAIFIGVLFFATAVLIGTPASDGFLFGVGVTVALVPEGLLPTVTLSLAIGAQRMAARHALVRRLEAVETLGSTTFICTDKTGTLTRNQMAVVEAWTPAGSVVATGEGYDPAGSLVGVPAAVEAAQVLAAAAAACSHGSVVQEDGQWVSRGDPMESAIAVFAARARDGGELPEAVKPVIEHSFDPHRRRMSVVVPTDGGLRVLVKGAPEAVLERCAPGLAVDAQLESLTHAGLRVLAVAQRALPAGTDPHASSAADLESDLELVGLLAFADPPRLGARDAIARCRAAGIRVAMLTGDHPATASAIADAVGLRPPDGLVLDGTTLPDDDAVLTALVDRDGVVVSRVSPEDKLRIARVLRARGHVVAMTGDGVNDGPALHASDIGVAMGRSGTDVARESADLVLLDDEFGTIVAAVEQGRSTFANLRRFLTYHLTDNVAELTPFAVWALSGGRFPLAIGVLQVLCLDIGTDMLPALALGAESTHRGVMNPIGADHVFDKLVRRRAFMILGPTEALIAMTAFVASLAAAGWRPGDAFPTGHPLEAASGAAFTAVVIGQLANAFACRSTTSRPGQLGWTTNRLLLAAVAIEIGLLAGFLFFPPLADLLNHRPPPLAGWLVALLAAPAVLAVDAADKWHRAQRPSPKLSGARGSPGGVPGA